MTSPRHVSRRAAQQGFTLIELMISISLVAVITTGMLYSITNGLMTLERVQVRLDENRRVQAVDRLLRGQLSGVIAAQGRCQGQILPIFRGTATRMLMVSTYSRTAGSRGLPVIVEYAIAPSAGGTFRLMAREIPFSGPFSTEPVCWPAPGGGAVSLGIGQAVEVAPSPVDGPGWVVMADGLATARFAYQEFDANTRMPRGWITSWRLYDLPVALRIEMTAANPGASPIPIGPVTVPLHVTQQVGNNYEDIL